MRDDIGKLNMSPRAKAYARRGGLASMMRQPKDFQKVNAEISNPGKPDKFVNRDAVGKVKLAMKDSAKIKRLATKLLERVMDSTKVSERS